MIEPMTGHAAAAETPDALADAELVRRARLRDEDAVRTLTRRYNQRLFRIARGILRNDADAEDAVQEAYVKAFTSLDRFRGDAAFGTWLTRIAMNEALGRLRSLRRHPTVDVDAADDVRLHASILQFPSASVGKNPERGMADRETRELLERLIDDLPDDFRLAFVARMVEGLSVDETAELLGVRAETVKTRVHRARRRLRDGLEAHVGSSLTRAFQFDGARCERLTESVVRRLRVA